MFGLGQSFLQQIPNFTNSLQAALARLTSIAGPQRIPRPIPGVQTQNPLTQFQRGRLAATLGGRSRRPVLQNLSPSRSRTVLTPR